MIFAAVPARNEERTIGKAVIGILGQADKVVVVEDGSSNPTGEIAEKLDAVVILGPAIGGRANISIGEELRPYYAWMSVPLRAWYTRWSLHS